MAKGGNRDRDTDQSSTTGNNSNSSSNTSKPRNESSGASHGNQSNGYGQSVERPMHSTSGNSSVRTDQTPSSLSPTTGGYSPEQSGRVDPGRVEREREVARAQREVIKAHVPGSARGTRALLDKPVAVPKRERVVEPKDVGDTRREAKRPSVREREPVERVDKRAEPVKKEQRPDNRPHCKARPDDNRRSGRGGGGKKFAPWCSK